MDMKMINRYEDKYFLVWLYVCYMWWNELSIEMQICFKIVGLIGKIYPVLWKFGKKERLVIITTEKKIVWKLFNMNWTFIYLKIVWYDIKWDSLRGEFLFFESKRDSSTPKVWESSTPQTWESSTPWIWEYHTPLFEPDDSAILDATSARGCGTPLLSNWYVVKGLPWDSINQVHKDDF